MISMRINELVHPFACCLSLVHAPQPGTCLENKSWEREIEKEPIEKKHKNVSNIALGALYLIPRRAKWVHDLSYMNV